MKGEFNETNLLGYVMRISEVIIFMFIVFFNNLLLYLFPHDCKVIAMFVCVIFIQGIWLISKAIHINKIITNQNKCE